MKFLYKPLIILGVLLVFGVANARIYNPPAWLDNWDNRVQITTNNSQVAENLTNYPAYFDFNGLPSNFWATVQSNGIDVRLTSSDATTVLNHELVAIDTSAETGEIHFDTVSISSTTDTVFYLYYNNSSASNISTSSTWNSSYEAVYHFQENPATASTTDATVNDNTGTPTGLMQATGQIGNAVDNNKISGNEVHIGAVYTVGTNDLTLSTWLNLDSAPANIDGDFLFYNKDDLGGNNRLFLRVILTGGNTRVNWWNADTSSANFTDTTNLSTGTWYYIVATRTGANGVIYVNENSTTGTTRSGNIGGATNWTLTTIDDGAAFIRPIDGQIDEMRILSTTLSSGWVLTEFNNQASSTAFWAIGAEESAPANFLNGGGFNF